MPKALMRREPPFGQGRAQAMILAAGRGARMRPLTDRCPKPLLEVHGKALMQWPMEALCRSGVAAVVVNTDWLGAQIAGRFGACFEPATTHGRGQAGESAGRLRIVYSDEGRDFGGALETAGGIIRALPQLDEVFWLLAGDVYAPDFVFSDAAMQGFAASGKLAHIWLVPNPDHHPNGDFGLQESADGSALALASADPRYTYSTIGLYRRALFAPPYCPIPAGNPHGVRAALAPILRAAMDRGEVSAQHYTGLWVDVGTPERLAQINQRHRPTRP